MLKKFLAACAVSIVLSFGAVLVQAPPSLAMWLVDTHVDFFEMPYPKWAQRHSLFDRILVRGVAYKLGRDWVTRAKTEIKSSKPTDIISIVTASRDYLSREFVNQRQIRHKSIDLPTYSRLVFGMAWCGGQNHLFTMILGEFFDEVHTFALFDRTTGKSPHVAATVTINQIPVYVDAWSDVPIFAMDDQIEGLGIDIPSWSDVHKNITLQQMDGTPSRKTALARDIYENGEKRIRARKVPIPIGVIGDWADSDAMPDKRNSPFQIYLKGSIFQLYGHDLSARNHYESIQNDPNLPPTFQRAAVWFLRSMAREL